MNAQKIFDAELGGARLARSPQFSAGALAALAFRCGEARSVECPHVLRTPEADAWFWGVDAGHAAFREYEDRNS